MIHSFFELTMSLFVSFTCFIKFVKLYFDPQMHYLDPTTWCGICSRFFPISKSRAPLANFSNRSLYDEQMNPLLSRDFSYLSRIRSNAFVSWTRADAINSRVSDLYRGKRGVRDRTVEAARWLHIEADFSPRSAGIVKHSCVNPSIPWDCRWQDHFSRNSFYCAWTAESSRHKRCNCILKIKQYCLS